MTKRQLQGLPKPSVFLHNDRWVCDYYRYDLNGSPKARRKKFIRELKSKGIEPSLQKQREAAIAFREAVLKEKREQEHVNRREKEQDYLSLKELKEAKAAYALFNQIPSKEKSLVDAVILYRDHLKLAQYSPPLANCIEIFLQRKKEASEGDRDNRRISPETFRTINQRLRHLLDYFQTKIRKPDIKIGEVKAQHLIEYFEELEVSERTRKNYIQDIANFFNDASDPRDENRFINDNLMDGVYVHYKKNNLSRSLKYSRNERKAPKILQIEEVKHVLDVAWEMRDKGMLGFTVCGLFLGMRPSEIIDMVSEEDFRRRFIKLEEGIVRIDGFGKKRDQRNILITDNCRVWLAYLLRENLPFCFPKKKNGQNLQYANFRARAYIPKKAEELIRLRRLHKTGKKPNQEEKAFMEESRRELQEYEDVLRHTCGTNLYYKSGFDKNLTIEQMGHSSEIFIEHYRGLLNDPDDHKSYWNLYPDEWIKL